MWLFLSMMSLCVLLGDGVGDCGWNILRLRCGRCMLI